MKQSDIDYSMLTPDTREAIDAVIEPIEDRSGQIMHILHEAQNIVGYLPPAVQLYIAQKTDLPAAKVNGIVTFYSFFKEDPKGTFDIAVCMGTACYVKGADKVLAAFKKELGLEGDKTMTDDFNFAISDVRCIGACGLAPVVRINDKIYGHVKENQVSEILADLRQQLADMNKGA